jgi:hypothetical protein
LAQAPAGWKVRIDRSTTATDPDAAGDVRIVTAGSGFLTTNPQAAVFRHPTNTTQEKDRRGNRRRGQDGQ